MTRRIAIMALAVLVLSAIPFSVGPVGRDTVALAVAPRADIGWQAESTISANGSAVYDAVFSDATTGWAVGANGGLYVTTDGGQTWATRVTGITNGLYQIVFPDAQDGYAAGDSIILHTANGGASWQQITRQTSPTMPNHIFALTAPSATTLVVAATPDNGPNGVYESTDSGATWQLSLAAEHLNDVLFTTPTTGWVLGQNVVSQTVNGGATWQTVFDTTSGPTNNFYQTIVFASQSVGYMLDYLGYGNNENILSTADGGATWIKVGSLPGYYNSTLSPIMAFLSSTQGLIGTNATGYAGII